MYPSRRNTSLWLLAIFAPEKKILTSDNSGSIFPTTPRQRSNPHPGKALKIKFLPPREQKVVKFPGFAREGRGRMLKFRFRV